MKYLNLMLAVGVLSWHGAADAQTQEEAFKARIQEAKELKLKDFEPHSIFNIPETHVEKARFSVIDAHSHDYALTDEEIRKWIETQKKCGIEKTHIMHCEWIGRPFEEIVRNYGPYKDHFAFWCCFDYTGFDKPGWEKHALESLNRAWELGAVGVGEMDDKGFGDTYARPVSGKGIHLDDPRLRPLIERCGELGMPINIHVAEPIWMYQPLDNHNDGLLNGATWAIDTTQEGCYDYEELMQSFERALKAYPNTTFIACHYLNMTQDLERLGALLDRYPNFYIDLAGRLAESTVTPRATRRFLIKYADRVLYGTDNGTEADMYQLSFRLLETEDEHIYNPNFGYHWSYSALNLPDDVLKKIYHDNATRLFQRKKISKK